MTKALHDYSIAEAGALLRSGTVTSMALTEHALGRIKAIDPSDQQLHHGDQRSRAGRCRRGRRRFRQGHRPWTDAGHSACAEGHLRHGRHHAPPATRSFSSTTCRRKTASWRRDSRRRAPCCSASWRRTSSRSADRRSTCRFRRHAIPGIRITFRAAPRPARVPRSQPASCAWRWAPTRAGRSAGRPDTAARSD